MKGMRIGVLSDSHGDAIRTRIAVEELVRLGATMFIHCGDIETIECLDPLAGLDAHIVFGNCDEPSDLQDYARSIDITVHHPLGEIIIDDQRIAFTHGDDPKSMQRPIIPRRAGRLE
jgi:predicted phosphodiesterase